MTERWAHMEHKFPPGEYEVSLRQMSLYAEGLFEQYRDIHPVPMGPQFTQSYSDGDVAFTLQWWGKYQAHLGGPVLVNKLRGRGKAIHDYNDLIHPETLAAMARPLR
jgi:hypothetical protein